MTAIIISVINWKGGVGKTTLTHHLGTGLNFRRKRTLLVDLDPQCNLSTLALGYEMYHRRIAQGASTIETLFDFTMKDQYFEPLSLIQKMAVRSKQDYVFNNTDLILSHMDLTYIDKKLASWRQSNYLEDSIESTERSRLELDKLTVLRNLLEPLRDKYDYILLDCPADLHLVTQNALVASDYYLVPTTPDYLSTIGLTTIRHQIAELDRRYTELTSYIDFASTTTTRFAGVIFNKIQEYGGKPTQSHQRSMTSVKAQISSENVFENYLLIGDGIQSAASESLPVFALEGISNTPKSTNKQISYLHNIIFELLQRTHNEVLV